MARFLSQAWTDEFNSALEGVVIPDLVPTLASVPSRADSRWSRRRAALPTETSRSFCESTAVALHLDLGAHHRDGQEPPSGGGRAQPTPMSPSRCPIQMPAAMSKGELSPAEALNTGRIRVRGDLSVLVAGQQMFEAARSATRDLVASTTY